jgi:hypothetical protein
MEVKQPFAPSRIAALGCGTPCGLLRGFPSDPFFFFWFFLPQKCGSGLPVRPQCALQTRAAPAKAV